MNKREFTKAMTGGYERLEPTTDDARGYVNGYRWGVEYPTNGKKPDLADDVVISFSFNGKWKEIPMYNFALIQGIDKFKITDQRYKPADTSYLETPALEPVPEESWYDYDNQKAIALPPVNELIEAAIPHTNGRGEQSVIWIEGFVIAHHKIKENVYSWFVEPGNGFYPPNVLQFRPLDWNRKAEAEKKRVVDAAFEEAITAGCVDFHQWLGRLYDTGYLKLPAE